VTNKAYIDKFLTGVETIVRTIPREPIDQAIDALYRAWETRRTVFVAGNGGSSGTATHLAADLNKMTVIPGQPRLRAMSLADNAPLVSAIINDDGWENLYTEQLETRRLDHLDRARRHRARQGRRLVPESRQGDRMGEGARRHDHRPGRLRRRGHAPDV
jgi:hypothetical protein